MNNKLQVLTMKNRGASLGITREFRINFHFILVNAAECNAFNRMHVQVRRKTACKLRSRDTSPPSVCAIENLFTSRATGLINSRWILVPRQAEETLSRTHAVKFLNSRLITFPSFPAYRVLLRFPGREKHEKGKFLVCVRAQRSTLPRWKSIRHLCVPWIYSHNRRPSFSMNFASV